MSKAKTKSKTPGKFKALLWSFALCSYGVGLSIFLTALAPQILELMRKSGVWQGLGITSIVYFALLMLLPTLIKLKVKKAPFGKLTLAWSIVALGVVAFAAPVKSWVNDRGSFVPALLLGPDSAIVQRVVVEKLEWGEGWKKRDV